MSETTASARGSGFRVAPAAARGAARDAALLWLVCSSLWGTIGCGDSACGGLEPSGGPSAPVVESFDLDRQLDGDPWTLVFALTFRDDDGDLGGGEAGFFLNDLPTPTAMPLDDALAQVGLPADARSGTVALPLRFGDNLVDDSNVTLGLQLSDAAGRRSNCFTLDLHFAVESIARRMGLAGMLKTAMGMLLTMPGETHDV